VDEDVLVIAADEIPDGAARKYPVGGDLTIAVFRSGGEYFAIDDRCPHKHASLCEGQFDGRVVVCPAHGWQVDVRSGRGVNQRFLRVRRFDVEVEDGRVRVAIGR
jgi:nitrite reductase/ring-hydroxylating ferredoxin subunit